MDWGAVYQPSVSLKWSPSQIRFWCILSFTEVYTLKTGRPWPRPRPDLIASVGKYTCIYLWTMCDNGCLTLLASSLTEQILDYNMYDSCMMLVFTHEAVQNVYADFQSYLNWLRTFPLFYVILYCIVFYIVSYKFASLPMATKNAHVVCSHYDRC